MAYQIRIKRNVVKTLKEIDEPYYSAIKSAMYNLADNPRPNGCKKLKGKTGYRIRVATYRIIYEIFDKILLVEIVELGHRKDIYD